MTRKQKVRGLIAASIGITVAITLGAGACDKVQEPFKDAQRTNVTNGAPADTITMPDGFSNVATKCDHGNRVYTAYHGDLAYASIYVVPQDPTCAQR